MKHALWAALAAVIFFGVACVNFDQLLLDCKKSGKCFVDAGDDGGSVLPPEDGGFDAGCPLLAPCGQTWCPIYVSDAGARLVSITGSSANEIWAAGPKALLTWNGCGFSSQTADDLAGDDSGVTFHSVFYAPTAAYTDGGVSSSPNLWLAGDQHIYPDGGTGLFALFNDGGAWDYPPAIQQSNGYSYWSVAGADSDNVWLGATTSDPYGNQTELNFWSGIDVQDLGQLGGGVTANAEGRPVSITTNGITNVWIATDANHLWYFDGGTWDQISAGSLCIAASAIPCPLHSIAATGAGRLVTATVAPHGIEVEEHGVWRNLVGSTLPDMEGAFATPEGDVFVVGDAGTVYEVYLDAGYTQSHAGGAPGPLLRAVWADSPTNVWIISDDGSIFHNN